jgi:hypothetical protein
MALGLAKEFLAAPTVRARMNHPTTVKRAYDAAHETAATPAAKGETRVEKLEHEIERLTCEVEARRKKASDRRQPVRSEEGQRQGYRHTITDNVSLHRLTALR